MSGTDPAHIAAIAILAVTLPILAAWAWRWLMAWADREAARSRRERRGHQERDYEHDYAHGYPSGEYPHVRSEDEEGQP